MFTKSGLFGVRNIWGNRKKVVIDKMKTESTITLYQCLEIYVALLLFAISYFLHSKKQELVNSIHGLHAQVSLQAYFLICRRISTSLEYHRRVLNICKFYSEEKQNGCRSSLFRYKKIKAQHCSWKSIRHQY